MSTGRKTRLTAKERRALVQQQTEELNAAKAAETPGESKSYKIKDFAAAIMKSMHDHCAPEVEQLGAKAAELLKWRSLMEPFDVAKCSYMINVWTEPGVEADPDTADACLTMVVPFQLRMRIPRSQMDPATFVTKSSLAGLDTTTTMAMDQKELDAAVARSQIPVESSAVITAASVAAGNICAMTE